MVTLGGQKPLALGDLFGPLDDPELYSRFRVVQHGLPLGSKELTQFWRRRVFQAIPKYVI